jgi:hypothetical protein
MGEPHFPEGLAAALPGLGEVHYERRIVTFFDILGWRRHIEQAASDPLRLAEMNFILHVFAVFESIRTSNQLPGARISTFSDNVAISVPYNEEFLSPTIIAMARVQLGLAISGFLVRGAITVGDLYHSEAVVFGPALVRAYELESTQAVYPRVLLDTDVPAFADKEGSLLSRDGDLLFIDPFHAGFAEELMANPVDVSAPVAAMEEALNVRMPALDSPNIPGVVLLNRLLERWSQEMAHPLRARDWEKLAWVFDRVAQRLGLSVRAAVLPRNPLAD